MKTSKKQNGEDRFIRHGYTLYELADKNRCALGMIKVNYHPNDTKAKNVMKKYTITLTEEQMRLIAEGMEDYHRFLSGECRMFNAVARTSSKIDSQSANEFERFAHKVMTPELQQGRSYKWNGGSCPNDHQRKAIAMSYMIYREILHTFAMQRPMDIWDTLRDPTLTCEEQGPLIKIEEAQQ